jgi:hypothetical protein
MFEPSGSLARVPHRSRRAERPLATQSCSLDGRSMSRRIARNVAIEFHRSPVLTVTIRRRSKQGHWQRPGRHRGAPTRGLLPGPAAIARLPTRRGTVLGPTGGRHKSPVGQVEPAREWVGIFPHAVRLGRGPRGWKITGADPSTTRAYPTRCSCANMCSMTAEGHPYARLREPWRRERTDRRGCCPRRRAHRTPRGVGAVPALPRRPGEIRASGSSLDWSPHRGAVEDPLVGYRVGRGRVPRGAS